MNKHLFLLILSPLFFVLTAISQPKGDYVVKVNNDTVPITLIDWGTTCGQANMTSHTLKQN